MIEGQSYDLRSKEETYPCRLLTKFEVCGAGSVELPSRDRLGQMAIESEVNNSDNIESSLDRRSWLFELILCTEYGEHADHIGQG